MTYSVSGEEVAAAQGLEARYFDNSDWEGAPALVRREAAIDGGGAPDSLALPYTVEWTGSLLVPQSGFYRIRASGDGEGTVFLDDEPFPDRGRVLATGLHPVRVRFRQDGPTGPTLAWETAGTTEAVPPEALFAFDLGLNGLLATYWDNFSFEGQPSFFQIDRAIYASNIIQGPYSIEWNGWLWVEQPGEYTLATVADEGSLLYLDGALVVDNGGFHSAVRVEQTVNLTRGYHEMRLRFWQRTGGSLMELRWTPPDGMDVLIPPEAIFYRLPGDAPPIDVRAGTEPVGPRLRFVPRRER
jgi:hypothetical protein